MEDENYRLRESWEGRVVGVLLEAGEVKLSRS